MDGLYQFRVHWNRHTYLQLLLVQIASGREGLAYDWFLVNRFPRSGRIRLQGLAIASSLSTIRVRWRAVRRRLTAATGQACMLPTRTACSFRSSRTEAPVSATSIDSRDSDIAPCQTHLSSRWTHVSLRQTHVVPAARKPSTRTVCKFANGVTTILNPHVVGDLLRMKSASRPR